jgi:hypothetical protein
MDTDMARHVTGAKPDPAEAACLAAAAIAVGVPRRRGRRG